MASGLSGTFGFNSINVKACSLPFSTRWNRERSIGGYCLPNPQGVEESFHSHKTRARKSTLNTVAIFFHKDDSFVAYATGLHLNRLRVTKLSYLDDFSAKRKYVSDCELSFPSAVRHICVSGCSTWRAESILLVYWGSVVQKYQVIYCDKNISLKTLSKFNVNGHVSSISSCLNPNVNNYAVLTDESEGTPFLNICGYDNSSPITSIKSDAFFGTNVPAIKDFTSDDSTPFATVQYAMHPQLIHISWLDVLYQFDMRCNKAQPLFSSGSKLIVKCFQSSQSNYGSIPGRFNENNIILSLTEGLIFDIDMRYTTQPLSQRNIPDDGHRIMKSCQYENSWKKTDNVFFAGTIISSYVAFY